MLDGLKQGVLLGLAILALTLPPPYPYRGAVLPEPAAGVALPGPATGVALPGPATGVALPGPATGAAQTQQAPRFANFLGEEASAEVRHIANWVVDSGDNSQLFFVIIDKKNTRVFVFDSSGNLRGATPVLIGSAIGDEAVAGIGRRPIAEVQPHERTTSAGRFMGESGRNASGEDVVWVDYDAAVSMHRVRTVEPSQRRLERLASPTTEDNRISYGCINMPVEFFDNVLKPAFNASYGVVYVLPEVKSVAEVFTSAYDVAAKHGVTPTIEHPNPARGIGMLNS
ncbi:hypothetical protein [Polaromonas sp.]|uniref:hypothetical protein n=1 Tax=Polaromonas sp. TaxID=1869339 RepID=UPI002FC708DA